MQSLTSSAVFALAMQVAAALVHTDEGAMSQRERSRQSAASAGGVLVSAGSEPSGSADGDARSLVTPSDEVEEHATRVAPTRSEER